MGNHLCFLLLLTNMAPLFLLTPATLMWSAPFGTYATTLGLRAAFHRKDMLTKYQSEKPSGSGASADKTEADEVLGVLSRSHANFSEHVPLAMILISLAEMNGAPLALIHSLYGTLLGLRIFHVEFGLKAVACAVPLQNTLVKRHQRRSM